MNDKQNLLNKIREVSGQGAALIKNTGADPKERIRYISLWRMGIKGILICALGFLLSGTETAFSSKPLGFALLGALEGYAPFAYLGTVISTVFYKGLALQYFIVYTAQFVLRIILCRLYRENDGDGRLFTESFRLRVSNTAVMSGLLSLYKLFAGGLLFYDLSSAVFSVLVSPILCFLLCGLFSKNSRVRSVHTEAGLYTAAFLIVFALRSYTLFGFSLTLFAAFFFTLWVSKSGGPLRGVLAGLVSGAAISTAKLLPFSAAGLISGLLWPNGAATAVFASFGISSLCDLYSNGLNSLAYFALDILAASLIFTPAAKYLKFPFIPFGPIKAVLPKKLEQSIISGEQKQKDTEKKIFALSEAMASLSETFFILSDRKKRPALPEIKQMCEDCFERSCRTCRKNAECWSKEYLSTTDTISKFAEALYNLGRIENDRIPEHFYGRCPNIELILEELNGLHADLLQNSIKGNKAEVFAIDYEQMSKLLAQAIIENDEEYEKDAFLTERVEKYMGYMNFHASCLTVYGKRRKSIRAYGVDLSKLSLSSEELKHRFERICGVKLKSPSFCIENDYVTMSIDADRRFAVKSAYASSAKDGEKYNGDGLCLFNNRQDYFYALLSDGMGSGKSAALSSGLTGMFLKKMLEAGNKKSVSIEMLNHILREKGGESSATVDLLEIDLISGNASFIKSGAASSYIIRKGRLFNINTNSMPIGITKEINAEEIKFTLEDGDTVVMMSDGISQSFEDGIWIADLLSCTAEKKEDIQSLADKILLNADLNSLRSDDMTVAVIELHKI